MLVRDNLISRWSKFLDSGDMFVYLLSEVERIDINKNCVEFSCKAEKLSRECWANHYNTSLPLLKSIEESKTVKVFITFVDPYIFNLKMGFDIDSSIEMTPMISKDFKPKDVEIIVEDREEDILISSGVLKLKITKKPFNISIYDSKDKFITQEIPYNLTGGPRGKPSYDHIPLAIIEDKNTGELSVCESYVIDYDEHFYGLGERGSKIDLKGQNIELWPYDTVGNHTPRMYKCVPFFMSSKGYGIYLNTSFPTRFDMGAWSFISYTIYAKTDHLDYFFIYGPRFKEILSRYTEITGKPKLPPKWSFGLWMSRCSYRSREEVLGIAKKLREEKIPCDVIHIDYWHNLDFEFTKEFSDPESMIRELKENGFKLSLWQHPYLIKDTRIYEEAKEKGYLAKDKNGEPFGDIGIIDLSNPEAVVWYKNVLRRLLELGAAVIKADFGEAADENAQYMNINSEAMHNLFPLLYNKAVFEITEEVKGKGNGIIWARSAYAGSQRYPLHWSGDITANFYHLQTVLRSGLQFGLSGFVFWSHDIGGFLFEPSPKLYVRWAQFGLFCSHSRCHGTTPREPWHYGEEALKIFKKYDELRYSLIPYIYSQAHICVEKSLPMVRALVLEYQDDKNVYHIDDEYLFGDSLLVAPILNEEDERDIYLPEGVWYDFWTDREYIGGQWINYKAPLDVMPIFVKKGSIIPMQETIQYLEEGLPKKIKLAIWPDKEMKTKIIDKEEIEVAGKLEKDRLVIYVDSTSHDFEVELHGVEGIQAYLVRN